MMSRKPKEQMPPKLAAFKKSLNRATLLFAVLGILVAELGVWFGVYFLEITRSESNWILTVLDFIVSFRLLPTAALFLIYGIVAYTVVKLGTKHSVFQIITVLVYSVLTLFAQAFEALVSAAYSYEQSLLATLPEYLNYMASNIGYWIASIVLVLIPPLILFWLCVVFAADYRAKKASRALSGKQKNPMPRIYFWLVIVWSILQLFSIIPQSVSDYRSLGFFQNISEAVTFFEPYIELVIFGIGGYWLMRLVSHCFRKKASVLIGKAEADKPVAEEH